MRTTLIAVVALAGCMDVGMPGDPGEGSGSNGGSGSDHGSGSGSGSGGVDPRVCERALNVPTSGRPVELMPADKLAALAADLPCVNGGPLRDVLESADTMWYSHDDIVPGYQDSFGDN